MSFFEDASLVLIPSAQKLSKIYSVKPTDGTGDLAFTRSNDTATRVASNGLIEKVRTNVALYSEDQTNWSIANETNVTANAAANPLNGAVTADKIIPTAVSGDHYRGLTMATMNGEITASIFVKADGYNFIDFGIYNTAIAYPVRATFDLSTQTFTLTTGSIASITAAGSGYFRISITASVPAASSIDIYQRVRPTGGTGNFTGDGTSGMLLWGCQLESGVMTPYIGPTTTAAVSVGPVANVPRLDYLNSSCPRLLLEPQRSSLINFSEQIDNAWWTKQNLSITANQAISPDGYTNADLITLSAGLSVKQFYSTSFTPYVSDYAYSGFFKKGTHNFIQFLAGPTDIVNFDLTLGTYNSLSATSGKIENYGNGWYRCTMLASGAVSAISIVNVVAVDSLTSSRAQSTSSTGTFYAWGMQVEAGAYATSYIPTLGASVTRGVDNTLTASLSGVLPQTAGTMFWEIDYTLGSTSTMLMHNTGVSDYGFLQIGSSGVAEGGIYESGVMVDRLTYSGLTSGTYKMAFAYETNSFALYINGVLRDSGTSGSTASISMNTISLDWNSTDFTIVKQTLLFPTRLTNAQLAELTA